MSGTEQVGRSMVATKAELELQLLQRAPGQRVPTGSSRAAMLSCLWPLWERSRFSLAARKVGGAAVPIPCVWACILQPYCPNMWQG